MNKNISNLTDEQFITAKLIMDKSENGFGIIKVSMNKNEKSYNFQLCYVNDKMAELKNTSKKILLSKSISGIFPDKTDIMIKQCYEAAYNDISTKTQKYDSETNKYLKISFYQFQYGYTVCCIYDCTSEHICKEIAHMLSKRYYKILKVNLTSDMYEEIKVDDIEKKSEAYSSKISQWIQQFALSGYVHKDDCDRYLSFCNIERISQELKNGKKSLSCHYRRLVKNEWRWIKMEIIPSAEYTNDNQTVLLCIIDVNDSIKAETALKKAYDTANKANYAKTKFLANISHDIRNSMNVIMGMTEKAQTYLNDKKKVDDCLSKITTSSKHLLDLVNEMLDMNIVESGKLSLNNENFNLTELINNLTDIFKPLMEKHRHEFSITLNNIEHENVVGDCRRIQQILMNLISNSIKYTPDNGKIKLYINEKKTNYPQFSYYEFIIEDNGFGMSEEFLTRLFEPMIRADDRRVEKIQGTGLGMAITKNIVSIMNGNITVESELNKGSKFTVTICLEFQDIKSDCLCSEKIIKTNFIGKKALLVENNILNNEIAYEILRKTGLEVKCAYNGKETIDIISNAEDNYFDIIFMDIQMPVMNGYEATKAIRSISGSYTQKLPIIAMTASTFSEDIINTGMNDYISKPLKFKHILEILDKWL
jgi:signal transduction histidine kinase/BarA-like signal transduction histidine kinase